jgi:hypothetical protein
VGWRLPVPPPELLTFYAGLAAAATVELIPSRSCSIGGDGDEFADDFTSAKHLVRLCCL